MLVLDLTDSQQLDLQQAAGWRSEVASLGLYGLGATQAQGSTEITSYARCPQTNASKQANPSTYRKLAWFCGGFGLPGVSLTPHYSKLRAHDP